MGIEYQLTGPPGTGKTTALARHARRAVGAHGSDRVTICSLTKAAAREIAARDTGVDHARVGTLHSLCYRALDLGGRTVLDSPKGLKLWNEWARAHGRDDWRVAAGGVDPDDPMRDRADAETLGDRMLARVNLLRHARVPHENETAWTPQARAFLDAWLAAMGELDVPDFTGMLELALATMPEAPGAPAVLIGDEAQDWSVLEQELFRQWGAAAETSVLAADADQTIFTFRGASPRVFLDAPVPDAQHRLLRQSYRVPRAVHAAARRIILRIRDRFDAPYAPRDADGAVMVEPLSVRRPEEWIGRAIRRVEEGSDAVILAPCSYMLDPAIAWLRRHGYAFGNRLRPAAGHWNPLGGGRSGNTARAQALAYLATDEAGWWTGDQLRAWVPLLRSRADGDAASALRHGAKAALADLPDWPSQADYDALWTSPEEGARARARSLDWLLGRASAKDRSRLAYVVAVYRRGGIAALSEEPRLQIGTVHSWKGGEASHVYLSTALPPRWAQNPNAADNVRLMYVGATRARETLTFLAGERMRFEV